MLNKIIKNKKIGVFVVIKKSFEMSENITRLKTIIKKLEANFSDKITPFPNKIFEVDYEKELDLQQLEAVKTISGKTLVIAGAGTGKTRVLVYRTSFLLENQIDPSQILLLTFTKKAANEIKKGSILFWVIMSLIVLLVVLFIHFVICYF